MAFVASMGVLAWNTRWRQVTFVAGALFVLGVGASRVYLGVHYPADVVGGWCVAIASVAGTWLVVRTVQARTAGPMNGSRSGVKGKDDERRGAGSAEDPAPETPAALSMKSVPRGDQRPIDRATFAQSRSGLRRFLAIWPPMMDGYFEDMIAAAAAGSGTPESMAEIGRRHGLTGHGILPSPESR